MSVINTNDSPKISLKRRPPHKASKNIFSDFLTLNFIIVRPIKKLITERRAPSKIDMKIKPDIKDEKYKIVITRSDRELVIIQKISSCFSFFTISSFQNRFNKGVHTCKYTKKSKDYR